MPAAVAPRVSSPPAVRWSLRLLLIASLALRLWMAHAGLAPYKVYDERFSIPNAVHALETRSLRPIAGYYPSLSYLPHLPFLAASEWLAGATGREALRTLGPGADPGQRFAPAGYLLARSVNALFGTLSIYLCYRIGAALWGPWVGLWGATLLAAVPWHARQSVVFKPDIVVVAAAPLAFLLAWRATRTWRPRDFALAGVGVALAAGAKFNGALLAIGVTAGALLRGGPRRATLARLALAGAVSIVVFLALNPYLVLDFELYRRNFGTTLDLYEDLGARAQSGHLGVALSAVRCLANRFHHGPLVALLALAGLVLPLTPRFRPPDRDRRVACAMLAAMVIGYIAVYAAATTNPRAWHNFLPLTPFTAVAAGWSVERAGRTLAGRARRRLRPALPVVAALLLALLFRPVLVFAHNHAVPDTRGEANRRLRLAFSSLPGRVVFDEVGISELEGFARRGPRPIAAVRQVRALDRIGRRRLDRADAEVIDGARLAGEAAPFYRQRVDRLAPQQPLRIESGLLAGRGPEILVLYHPWRELAPPVVVELERRRGAAAWQAALPPLPPAFLSGELLLYGVAPGSRAELSVDGKRARLIRTDRGEGVAGWTSERLKLPARRRVTLRLALAGESPRERHPVILHFWQPPGKPMTTPQLRRFRQALRALRPAPPAD